MPRRSNRRRMEIKVKRIGSRVFAGNVSITVNTYRVIENCREFTLARTSHVHGRSLSMEGEKGILYVDSDDNRVHRQVTTPSGACGLNTDDEPVEGLSPWAIRAVIAADQRGESGEISITAGESESSSGMPVVYVNGKVSEGFL
jgi:hypothetical protein